MLNLFWRTFHSVQQSYTECESHSRYISPNWLIFTATCSVKEMTLLWFIKHSESGVRDVKCVFYPCAHRLSVVTFSKTSWKCFSTKWISWWSDAYRENVITFTLGAAFLRAAKASAAGVTCKPSAPKSDNHRRHSDGFVLLYNGNAAANTRCSQFNHKTPNYSQNELTTRRLLTTELTEGLLSAWSSLSLLCSAYNCWANLVCSNIPYQKKQWFTQCECVCVCVWELSAAQWLAKPQPTPVRTMPLRLFSKYHYVCVHLWN